MKEILIAPMCIYRLPGGLTLFAEGVDLSGDELTFDMDRCAALNFVPMPDGGIGIQAQKASESVLTFGATKMTVPRVAVAIQNTTNLDLISNARQAVSGIQIARGPHR